MQGKSSPVQSSTDSSNPKMNLGAWLSLSQQSNYQTMSHMCPHCPKTFPSLQGLGGHQNAHRRERNEARRLFAQERLAYLKQFNILPPTPLRALPPGCGGPAGAPVVNPGPVPGFKPRLGWVPSKGPHENHYYHPYLKPDYKISASSSREMNLIQEINLRAAAAAGRVAGLEASSKTAESHTNAKAVNGSEDLTEVTSKRRMDLTLKLSP